MDNKKIITGYHGTKTAFKKFDYTRVTQNGSENGSGLYFTTDLQVAKMYGNTILKAEFIINQPFSKNKLTIKKSELKQFIKNYIDPTGSGLLNDFDDVFYYGYENILDKVVNDYLNYNNNDVDIISELLSYTASRSDNVKAIFDNIYNVFKKDYIYYKSKDFDDNPIDNYIIFSNKQILNIKEV